MAFVDFCNITTVICHGKDKYLYYQWNENWSSNTVDAHFRVFFSLRLQKGNIFISYEVFSIDTIL